MLTSPVDVVWFEVLVGVFESTAASQHHALSEEVDKWFTRWNHSEVMQEMVDEPSVVQVHDG